MSDNARGTHVTPGIYSREIELPRSVESIGQTTLGLVGETQKGPAFECVHVKSWAEFKENFGDVSPEKFIDTQYPKFEAPYIAKEYLSESESLEVVRVLGLCGYNAGPAWLITGSLDGKGKRQVVAVIRSRGFYKKYVKYTVTGSTNPCDCQYNAYDRLIYKVGDSLVNNDCNNPVNYDMSKLWLCDYVGLETFGNECEGYKIVTTTDDTYDCFGIPESKTRGEGGDDVEKYTQEEADEYNSQLPNAVHEGDVKTPAKEATEAQPAIYSFTAHDENTNDELGSGKFAARSESENNTLVTVTEYVAVEGAENIDGKVFKISEAITGLTSHEGGMELISGDTEETGILVKNVTLFSAAVEAQPAQDAVLYTAEEAALYNSGLDGAVSTATPKVNESVTADEEESSDTEEGGYPVNAVNNGRFSICGIDYLGNSFRYAVSLNPGDNDYIMNVIGTHPLKGDAPIFVESLYDVALTQGIANGSINRIDGKLSPVDVFYPYDYSNVANFYDILTDSEETLTKRQTTLRYLADCTSEGIMVHPFDYNTNKPYTVTLDEEHSTTSNKKYYVEIGYWDETSGESGAVQTGKLVFDYTVSNGAYVFNTGESSNYENIWGNDFQLISGSITVDSNLCLKHSSIPGQIYTVRQYTYNGKRNYFYAYYIDSNVQAITDYKAEQDGMYVANIIPISDRIYDVRYDKDESGTFITAYTINGAAYSVKNDGVWQKANGSELDPNNNRVRAAAAKCTKDGYYYRMFNTFSGATGSTYDLASANLAAKKVSLDLNDYRSQFSHAITPWIVSNAKGSANIELSKMFRFHTISDGVNSNNEVKISIANIRPNEGTFDVIVRDINDNDGAVVVKEKFSKCTMVPGSNRYIGYQIGTHDGAYETKSKYITVEIIESDVNEVSVPAGFLGYPTDIYKGLQIIGTENSKTVSPEIKYNTYWDSAVKPKRQYFGLSEVEGIDPDFFTFKGRNAYDEDDTTYLGNGFHLDCRLSDVVRQELGVSEDDDSVQVKVDGKTGYTFSTVDSNNRTQELDGMPIIASEIDMETCIYSDVNLRKFTVYFYGGFDGWDVYRGKRTTSDEFTLANYMGNISSTNKNGVNFGYIEDNSLINLNQSAIDSDYYAFLAAIHKFSNPASVDIDILATPGIDYVNDTLLVKDAIEMVETDRQDTIYVVTTPDKPQGASDAVEEMYTADDAVDNLEEAEIETTYACSYYPWVKFHDTVNNQYIMLPATKDVVKNFAYTDNVAHPWWAPAGIERGTVNCVKAHSTLKINEEDSLCAGRINPIKTFTVDGIKIWGQRTLANSYEDDSRLLSRVSVRRMMLSLRKEIIGKCKSLIFNPNDDNAAIDFREKVTPILDKIMSNRGITEYYMQLDTSAEARARRELPVKIFVKPINALEYIPIDFILAPENVSFEDL